MSDYISNRQTNFVKCPKCHNRTLKLSTWEEHLSAWGFSDYLTEYHFKAYCTRCESDTRKADIDYTYFIKPSPSMEELEREELEAIRKAERKGGKIRERKRARRRKRIFKAKNKPIIDDDLPF